MWVDRRVVVFGCVRAYTEMEKGVGAQIVVCALLYIEGDDVGGWAVRGAVENRELYALFCEDEEGWEGRWMVVVLRRGVGTWRKEGEKMVEERW